MTLRSVVALALIAAPVSAMAHGNMKPQHGGQVQISGETLVELVVTPAGVDIYASEEDVPANAAGCSAKLVQTAGGVKTEAVMAPAGGNRLSAAGFKPAKGARLVVALVDESGMKSFTTFIVK